MNERRKRVMKRLVVEELERRQMLASDVDVLTNNALELTSLPTDTDDDESTGGTSAAPDVDSGVGQQTITTGANTLGIGSFAMPTAGPSRAGGTGNPNLYSGGGLAAVDLALEELLGEIDDVLHAKSELKSAPAKDANPEDSSLTLGAKPDSAPAVSLLAKKSNAADAAQPTAIR